MQHVIRWIATAVVVVASSALSFASTAPNAQTRGEAAHVLHCIAQNRMQRLDRAKIAYARAAALARSGRGSQLARSDARAEMLAARLMAERAQFALAEAEAAFGPFPNIATVQC